MSIPRNSRLKYGLKKISQDLLHLKCLSPENTLRIPIQDQAGCLRHGLKGHNRVHTRINSTWTLFAMARCNRPNPAYQYKLQYEFKK